MKNLNYFYLYLGLIISFSTSCKMIAEKPNRDFDPAPIQQLSSPAKALAKSDQWALKALDLGDTQLTGNSHVRIAILSSGVDYNHPELVGQIQINQNEWEALPPSSPERTNSVDDDKNGLVDDFVGYDFVDQDGLAFDHLGLGTALAGVISARQDDSGVSGVAFGVKLVPYRVIDQLGQGEAMRYVDALQRALVDKIDIVLLHAVDFVDLEDFEINLLGEALTALGARGIPVVVGAGNSNREFGTTAFSKLLIKHGNVFPIAASSQSGSKSLLSDFSQQYVITSAPGENVDILIPHNGLGTRSSSTIAAAFVAGGIALAMSQIGPLSISQIRQAIVEAVGDNDDDRLDNICLSRGVFSLSSFMKLAQK